jgi:hypothetical protein
MKNIFAFLLITCLLACTPSLKEGEIYNKEFYPAETVMIMMPIVISTGRTCITMIIPMWFYYPDRWSINIRKFDGKEWRTAQWWIDQNTFNMAQIGGMFKYKDGDLDTEPRYECECKEKCK